ncbi:MAG: NBR1-Ig-like domain-containing protein [Anaerolineales bacterium]
MQKPKNYLGLITVCAFSLLLVQCTSEVEETAAPAWTPLPTVSSPPRPSPTVIGMSPTSAPRGECVNDAEFVDDLSIPDRSNVEPGSELDKRWEVRNSGSCDWVNGYLLVRIGSDRFIGPEEIALYPASAGKNAIWQVGLTVPFEPGEYIGRWQAQSPEGQLFGEEVYIWVYVPTPTPVPSPTGTATN